MCQPGAAFGPDAAVGGIPGFGAMQADFDGDMLGSTGASHAAAWRNGRRGVSSPGRSWRRRQTRRQKREREAEAQKQSPAGRIDTLTNTLNGDTRDTLHGL